MISGLSFGAAILAGGLLRVWARSRKSTGSVDTEGWAVLTPVGFVYPVAFVFPAAFLMLIIVFVIDKEPLNVAQTMIAAVTFLFLGIASAYSIWSTFGRRVRRKDESVRLSRWFLPDRQWRIADAREVTYSDTLGFRVTFTDGSRLGFTSYENGASELAELLRSKAAEANGVAN